MLETLARRGVSCDVYLLTVESAPDTAWSRAATYCACVQRWGIRVCGRLAELGVVGAPIPATRGPHAKPFWAWSRSAPLARLSTAP